MIQTVSNQQLMPVFICFDIGTYIKFYALRNFGVLKNGRYVTEQIYIHAKLLITDSCCIIGSANINDRRYATIESGYYLSILIFILFSLNGEKDSEICAIIFDAGKCRNLLARLIEEHTGHKETIGDMVHFFRSMCSS